MSGTASAACHEMSEKCLWLQSLEPGCSDVRRNPNHAGCKEEADFPKSHLVEDAANASCICSGKCVQAGRMETPGLYSTAAVMLRKEGLVPKLSCGRNAWCLSIANNCARRFVTGVRIRLMCREAPESLHATWIWTQHAEVS